MIGIDEYSTPDDLDQRLKNYCDAEADALDKKRTLQHQEAIDQAAQGLRQHILQHGKADPDDLGRAVQHYHPPFQDRRRFHFDKQRQGIHARIRNIVGLAEGLLSVVHGYIAGEEHYLVKKDERVYQKLHDDATKRLREYVVSHGPVAPEELNAAFRLYRFRMVAYDTKRLEQQYPKIQRDIMRIIDESLRAVKKKK